MGFAHGPGQSELPLIIPWCPGPAHARPVLRTHSTPPTCNSKVKSSPDGELFTLERAGGVEPPSAAWKAAIIAAIRCPLVGTVY